LPLCLRLPVQPLAERACKLLLASDVGVDAAGCEAGLYRIWLLGVSARDFTDFFPILRHIFPDDHGLFATSPCERFWWISFRFCDTFFWMIMGCLCPFHARDFDRFLSDFAMLFLRARLGFAGQDC